MSELDTDKRVTPVVLPRVDPLRWLFVRGKEIEVFLMLRHQKEFGKLLYPKFVLNYEISTVDINI